MTESDLLYNHETTTLSQLDLDIIRSVPPGGNWRNIPDSIVSKSKRLQQIKKTGGRTTYYGRMVLDKPSYTISTYFNRPGNGCFIHPTQNRLITQREAARLQSFPDSFRFYGSRFSRYKQIGNAVPPLLARAIAETISGENFIDLFAGAGGLAEGFRMVGHKCLLSAEINKNICMTLERFPQVHTVIRADLSEDRTINEIVEITENKLAGKNLDVIVTGPPCQGFSTAGNWDQDDQRNNLYKPLMKIVQKLTPRQVLIENVPGIKWMRKGQVLDKIKQLLQEMEYSVRIVLLKAEEYGVPQKRRRVFIFGLKKPESNNLFPPTPLFASPGEVKFDKNMELLHLPKPFTVEDAISDLPHIKIGGGAEILSYDPSWINSDYQSWSRGQISFKELYRRKCTNENLDTHQKMSLQA